MMKKLISAAVLGLCATGFNAALAHSGAKPQHGGIVQTANDLAFELVAQPDGATLYVQDHGQAMPPTGMSGKLTVLNGREKSTAELVATGDALQAQGIKIARGAKVVAAIQTAQKKTITVRFSVK